MAVFYSRLLGLEEAFATPDRGVIALAGAGPMLTLMRVQEHVRPSWPDGPQRQQLHLDIAVDELEPAGHPFCLTAVRPD
ncbi:VOC family protein [Sinomonas atrocyanea]|uniref:VOC family protein n=1 Tax=Sinomonas atrocyanea TaxID=37927 RepID=UPI0027D8438C|nr:VOC family protein [Sinomonas atrocyanea]